MNIPMSLGDYVKIFWDDNWNGQILYGRVIACGPRAYTVEWESGRRNRFRHNDPYRAEPERLNERPEDYKGAA